MVCYASFTFISVILYNLLVDMYRQTREFVILWVEGDEIEDFEQGVNK